MLAACRSARKAASGPEHLLTYGVYSCPLREWELPVWQERAMLKLILAVTIVALTAVTAFTAGGALVGSTDPGRQTRSGGVAGNPQGGFLRGGYDVIARGDMSGSGGGGMRGGMMGGMSGSMGKGKGQ